MQKALERHVITGPELQEKLEMSKAGAQAQPIRTVKCPVCGFYLLDVSGRDHYYIRVKCRKCKFDEIIDTALFRTMKTNQKKRLLSYSRRLSEELQR